MTRLVGDGRPWTTERAIARFDAGLADQDAGRGAWLTIHDRTDRRYVGLLAAGLINGSGGVDVVEVGIWITPSRWRTGVGREVLQAAVPLLAERYPGYRLVAEADVHHTASDRELKPDRDRSWRFVTALEGQQLPTWLATAQVRR